MLSRIATTLTSASILIVVVALSGTLEAQIPKEAKWEITFAQVEAAAGLPDLSKAESERHEARVMRLPGTAVAPMPFLRVVRTNGAMRAQMFLYWKPAHLAPSERPTGADIVCLDGVCVRPIGIAERNNWAEVVGSLALDACQQDQQGPPRPVCADCEHLWIKTKTNTYREQSCNMPKPETPAGLVLRLMTGAADASRSR